MVGAAVQGPCMSSLLWPQVLLKSAFGIQERELLRDDEKLFLLRYLSCPNAKSYLLQGRCARHLSLQSTLSSAHRSPLSRNGSFDPLRILVQFGLKKNSFPCNNSSSLQTNRINKP